MRQIQKASVRSGDHWTQCVVNRVQILVKIKITNFSWSLEKKERK